jgi:uncharacterized membrane protein/thiol-disulfide isomerase/thioredoxin
MNNYLIARVNLFVILLVISSSVSAVSGAEPVVYALLFYSPTCPHCYKVVTEDLPPIVEKYGDQVIILGINTYTEKGNELFLAAVGYFNIPREMAGVPMLIVGETVLIGSVEIPQQLPEIIATGLASGGIDWPGIPGLDQLLKDEISVDTKENQPKEDLVDENLDGNNQEIESNSDNRQNEFNEEGDSQTEQSSTVSNEIGDSITQIGNMTMADRFMQDKTGNSISTLVLVGMIFSVVVAGVMVFRSSHFLNQWPNWVVSVLWVIGIAVACYMAFVEVTHSEAVCGPVGDCNTVQQSSYASLFGLIPIGLLGVVGYLVIGIVWLVSFFGERKWWKISLFILWGLLLVGTLFSIYLTFLEPFVIGATCAWCLTSAVVMTLLFWNSTAKIQEVGGLN